MKAIAQGCLAGLLALACSVPALAQESKSAPLAKQLAAALDAAKLDSVAAKDPTHPGVYIAALYIPNVELLTIAAKYSAPQLLDGRLTKKEYRDIYTELNGAGQDKVFVEDIGIDGLKAKRDESRGPDSHEATGKRTSFDNDWKRQNLSEEAYMKASSDGDQRYSEMLTVLLAQLKRSS